MGNCQRCFCSPSGKGSTLKGKNHGVNSSILEWTPFQKGPDVQKSKTGSCKFYPL